MSGIVWLEGGGVDAGEVGIRAAVLARLRSAGLPVPRAFVLGRSLLMTFVAEARRDPLSPAPAKLSTEVQREIAAAIPALGGSFAIRRSPLEDVQREKDDWLTTTQGGRPERETYLHLTDGAEVSEAVRRIWGQALFTSPPPPQVAIMVQRFMAPDVCAVVRRDRADRDILHVKSSLGVGDLLAAGLVVPDRHTLRRDGKVLACSLGRKAQMSVPRPDGGVVRVPVPAHAARRMAIDDDRLAELAATWRAAEKALPGIMGLGSSYCGGRWHVTSGAAPQMGASESLMLG